MVNRFILGDLDGNVTITSNNANGKKRKSDELGDLTPKFQNCDQVRRKIRRYLESGEMNVGQFCKAIGVGNKSLNDFLRQNGPMKGSGSHSFSNAAEFFEQREMAGVKMPNKKQKTDAASSASEKSASSNIKAAGNSAGVDISEMRLDGEESDNVPVYDTCNEVRKKINLHVKKPGVTQAQLCRDIQAQFHSASAPSKIQPAQLDRFRSLKGPKRGCTSNVFYGAYVFFEKVRIKEGKAKSSDRMEMENIWPNGFERERDGSRGYLCHSSKRPYEDKYGRVEFIRI